MKVTYPGGGVFIEVIRQVNRPCLALVHFFQGDHFIGIGIRVLVGVSVSLGLGLGAHLLRLRLQVRDDRLWLLCRCFVSW